VSERPFPTFDLIGLGRFDFEQVPHSRRDDHIVSLEKVILLREASKCFGNIGCHGGLLCNYKRLAQF
jgi:hypothetical protein